MSQQVLTFKVLLLNKIQNSSSQALRPLILRSSEADNKSPSFVEISEARTRSLDLTEFDNEPTVTQIVLKTIF